MTNRPCSTHLTECSSVSRQRTFRAGFTCWQIKHSFLQHEIILRLSGFCASVSFTLTHNYTTLSHTETHTHTHTHTLKNKNLLHTQVMGGHMQCFGFCYTGCVFPADKQKLVWTGWGHRRHRQKEGMCSDRQTDRQTVRQTDGQIGITFCKTWSCCHERWTLCFLNGWLEKVSFLFLGYRIGGMKDRRESHEGVWTKRGDTETHAFTKPTAL